MKNLWLFALIASSLTVFASPSQAINEPGISNTEIKLGASYPMSGGPGGVPGFKDFFVGANAYFDYLNAMGGIYGRKVTVIYKDDRYQPQEAIVKNQELILQDKVFALFNSAPFPQAHIAVEKVVGINKRGIPDLALTSSFSLFSDMTKFPTTFAIAPNGKQESRVLLDYIKAYFPNLPLYRTYDSENDIGLDVKSVLLSYGDIFRDISTCITSTSVPQPAPTYITDSCGLVDLKPYPTRNFNPVVEISVSSNSFPLFLRGSALWFAKLPNSINNTYASFYLPLVSDATDSFVAFYTEIINKYSSGATVSQSMIEGTDAAYVVSQALAAIGPEPTRKNIIDFLRTKSSTLSSASFGLLNYGFRNDAGTKTQFIAKFDGRTWNKVSDLFMVDVTGNVNTLAKANRLPLLPNGLPVMKGVDANKQQVVTCVKGKITKKIAGINPKCPSGYTKK